MTELHFLGELTL